LRNALDINVGIGWGIEYSKVCSNDDSLFKLFAPPKKLELTRQESIRDATLTRRESSASMAFDAPQEIVKTESQTS
jgi:hypothetical protein